MGIGFVGFVSIYSGQLELGLFEGILYVLLELLVMSAVVIFFSSIVVTITLSGLFSLAAWLAGRSFGSLKYFFSTGDGDKAPTEGPLNIGEIVTKALEFLLPDLSRFNVADGIVYGQSAGVEHLAYGATYAVLYSAGLLVLAVFFFEKRELM